MTAYYNEIDPHAAQWLRNLIEAGHIAPGDVDERSIEDVTPKDLHGYTQCHFFAGIGGWAHALDLAGWPRDRPVWTGSCPCQPFSAAGKGAGFADERHLWPAWQHLIAQCRPAIVFGEQVASKAVDAWIDLVHADLEGMGYAFGCVPFPAAGIGAPHIRDRTYWVADASRQGLPEQWGERNESSRLAAHSVPGGLAYSNGDGCESRSASASTEGYGHPVGAAGCDDRHNRPGPTNGQWRDADWLGCRDGKWRPVEPGTQPLAPKLPRGVGQMCANPDFYEKRENQGNRVGRLRGYGNAIVPPQAAIFVQSFMEVSCAPDTGTKEAICERAQGENA